MGAKIKIAQEGNRLSDSADWETALSSTFKSLPIVESGTFTSTSSTTIQTMVTHSLGYRPMFVVYRRVSSGVWELATTGYSQFLFVDSSTLKFDNTSLGFVETFAYFVFAVDLETTITEVTEDTSAGTAVGSPTARVRVNNTGAVTAGKGNSFDSKYPPLLIQKLVNNSYTAGDTDTVSHALGTIPYFQAYYSNGAGTRYFLLYNASDSNVGVSTSQVAYTWLNAPSGCRITTVIFKRRLTTT